MPKKSNPGKFVPVAFCDERTRRIEQKIESTKTEIIHAITNHSNPPMPWQAKATIIASALTAVAAIIVAFIR